MKSPRTKLVVGVLATILGVTMFEGYVYAQADVDSPFLCNPMGTLVFDNHRVVTNNANGNGLLVCHGEGHRNPWGRTIVLSGKDYSGLCGNVILGSTDRWRIVLTKNGRITMTCHFPGSQA